MPIVVNENGRMLDIFAAIDVEIAIGRDDGGGVRAGSENDRCSGTEQSKLHMTPTNSGGECSQKFTLTSTYLPLGISRRTPIAGRMAQPDRRRTADSQCCLSYCCDRPR